MSDEEESFVILGTSPMSSIKTEETDGNVTPGTSLMNNIQKSQQLKSPKGSGHNSLEVDNANFMSGNEMIQSETTNSRNTPVASIKTEKIDANEGTPLNSLKRNAMTNSSGSSNKQSIRSANGCESSLAASFIMGEIDVDVLKTSVYSQFPSLCSMEACAEDVVKLQNFMTEYVELKNTLAKVNLTIKQYHVKTQQWREDMQRTEQQYKQQLQECQNQIGTLRNENMELKREIDTKIEQMEICENLRQKDHAELMQAMSEKTALINNMRAQIEKLEQHQLASFEYVPKNDRDSKDKPDYVDRLEHERMIKEIERKLSALLAQNLDLKDTETQYIDEITCLKVNLTAAEEIIKQLRVDIDVLKAKDIEKTETFTDFINERDKMKEELSLLKTQVDVYSRDFEMERVARQNLAGEKDQLLQDLRALQCKNQKLIEETQKQWESIEQHVASGGSPKFRASIASTSNGQNPQRPIRTLPNTPKPRAANEFYCPVCSKSFTTLSVLQSHVNDCLDQN